MKGKCFGHTVTRALHCFTAALALASLPAPGVEGPLVEKKPRGEEKPFEFAAENDRDPFTFRRKPIVQARDTVRDTTSTLPPGPVTAVSAEAIRQKTADMEKWYGEAELAFMLQTGRDTRLSEVAFKCDKGLELLKDLPDVTRCPDPVAVRDLLQVKEKLLELRRAGERVRQRQDAEKKFRDMNIRLTGVVARERRSQAIVNGKIVGKGEVVAVSENNDVVVDEIQPDQVIFLFQGYKMSLTLSDMPRGR